MASGRHLRAEGVDAFWQVEQLPATVSTNSHSATTNDAYVLVESFHLLGQGAEPLADHVVADRLAVAAQHLKSAHVGVDDGEKLAEHLMLALKADDSAKQIVCQAALVNVMSAIWAVVGSAQSDIGESAPLFFQNSPPFGVALMSNALSASAYFRCA